MPSILHVSDIHFGPPFLPDRAAAVRQMAEIAKPDLLVASGDFTQRAKRSFDPPIVVTPGNHDVPLYRVWERIFSPHALYREHIRDALNEVYRFEGLTVVALDSTRPSRPTNGKLRRGQLEFARRAFADAPDSDLRIVVTHHHLAPPPDFEHDRVMSGARGALRVFRDIGVDLVLAGHLHRAYIGDSLDFFPGERRETGIVIVQCGTTTSSRGRGRERLKNSLNWIEADRERILVRHYLWCDVGRRFRPHSEHRFGSRALAWLERGDGAETAGGEASEAKILSSRDRS
ncbi:MAG: metallophosphoesterase [Gemmatimonadales bacterium]